LLERGVHDKKQNKKINHVPEAMWRSSLTHQAVVWRWGASGRKFLIFSATWAGAGETSKEFSPFWESWAQIVSLEDWSD